jgi:TonB family protein
MNISEKGVSRLSLCISVVCHILFLTLLPGSRPIKTNEIEINTKIPVKIAMISPKKETINTPKKTVKKIINKKKNTAKKSPKKSTQKIISSSKKVEQKPHPGDRISPKINTFSSPVTPKIAINNEWEGTIIVKATISEKGGLSHYVITQSTGYKELDDAFIRTLQSTYSFLPKREFGKNKEGIIKISHTFKQ